MHGLHRLLARRRFGDNILSMPSAVPQTAPTWLTRLKAAEQIDLLLSAIAVALGALVAVRALF
jgi:hypothetical protein